MGSMNRREMLGTTGAAFATAVLGTGHRARGAPKASIRETKVISYQPDLYHGWPTVARRSNGQLLLVCSGGREAHVCPFGRVELMRSDDGGDTWGWPCVVMDCEIDDRDAGVMETDKGTLLITTFTSLAYESGLKKAEEAEASGSGKWPQERLRRWRAAHNRLTPEQRQEALGVWMIRSTDEGVTWSGRFNSTVNSPHGPVQLSGGRQLYAGKELWSGERRIGVCESTDDGQTWRWLAQIPTRSGDDPSAYHELHAVEAADGGIVVQIRNHNKNNSRETLQTESADGGKTWSEPHSIGVWGLPSHLTRLKDDRLLMTYGHRRQPYGNQARVSDDHGRTWSDPMIISGDGMGGDLGYPSTVQLDDGTLVSVWYERMKDSPYAVLRQAKWALES